MADSPYVFEIDETNYQQIVIDGSFQVPVLVDFWASWCQPCQVLMPVLAKLVEEYRGRFVLAKINTEEQQAIAAQFGIRSIPTVKLFVGGQPVDEFAGALPEAQIRAFLERHLPRASDDTVAQAQEQLLAGDVDKALALLDAAAGEDPDNPRIGITRAQVQAASGALDDAVATLDALPPDAQDKPEVARLRGQLFFDRIAGTELTIEEAAAAVTADPGNLDARYRLAAAQVVEGDVEQAMENFLTVMQKDRKLGDDGARKALLKLFDMLGDEPGVARYRARMFNLLH
jgi:putative thioredoxin